MNRRAIALALISVLIAACAASPDGTAGPSPSTIPATSAASSELPSSVPSGPPSSDELPPSTPTAETARPGPVVRPSAAPEVSWSSAERSLASVLRDDASVNCQPRRSALPSGAVAAIECFIGSTLVDRVGVYGFDHPQDAALAYFERMDEEIVVGVAGDCRAGIAGDVSWDGPDGSEDNYWHVEYAETVWSASRYGCFVNERGYANFRATCDTVYVGVLGNGSRLDELTEWALRPPEGESLQGPGICFGMFGGGLDGPDLELGPGDVY